MVAFYAVFPTKRLAHLSAGSGVFSPPAPLWFHSLHLFKFSNPCRDLAVIEKLFRFSVNTIGLHIASSIRHPIISMLRAYLSQNIRQRPDSESRDNHQHNMRGHVTRFITPDTCDWCTRIKHRHSASCAHIRR